MTKHCNLFPTPLWRVNLGDIDYNKELENFILNKSKTTETVYKTNSNGGWQSNNLLEEHVFSKLKQRISTYLQTLNLNILKVNYINLWCNINYKNSYNVIHNHGDNEFAIIYYVKCPKKSGELVLRDPRTGFIGKWGTDYAKNIHSLYNQDMIIELDIKDGDLIIFPGFLDHYVKPSASNNKRISIALDCFCEYF